MPIVYNGGDLGSNLVRGSRPGSRWEYLRIWPEESPGSIGQGAR